MRMVEIGKKDAGSSERIDKGNGIALLSQRMLTAEGTSEERLLATHGRTFHFAARFLSPMHRQQILTLYAFFRTLDDLVDKPAEGCQSGDILSELEVWKGWFAGGRSFPAPRETLGARLATILAEHSVPTTIFLDFLDGLAFDVETGEIREFRELYRYCYRVAGTVGLAMAHILGVNSPQGLAAAQNLGIAMQLTNILRDVGGDLETGRIYLPREDLERFGSSPSHLVSLYRERRGPDERFRALMRYEVARAHGYYVRGMSGIWLLPRNCRLTILLAGRLYRRILTVIEHRNYDVLRSRAATSLQEKLREAVIAFTLDQLWSRGEAFSSIDAEVLLEE